MQCLCGGVTANFNTFWTAMKDLVEKVLTRVYFCTVYRTRQISSVDLNLKSRKVASLRWGTYSARAGSGFSITVSERKGWFRNHDFKQVHSAKTRFLDLSELDRLIWTCPNCDPPTVSMFGDATRKRSLHNVTVRIHCQPSLLTRHTSHVSDASLFMKMKIITW